MSGIVVFDADKFKAVFPVFATYANTALTLAFNRACLYLNNSEASIVQNLDDRELLLFLAMAHILTLDGRGGTVGQIVSASEGSVSSSFSAAQGNFKSWWWQTSYGADFWQATTKYRSFQYV